jgi:hypothetical protein
MGNISTRQGRRFFWSMVFFAGLGAASFAILSHFHVDSKVIGNFSASSKTTSGPKKDSYVQIQGKYYKANSDNIYNIDGQRIYYTGPKREYLVKSETQETVTPDLKMPVSAGDMMNTLKVAQANIKERDKIFKEVMENDGKKESKKNTPGITERK